MPISTFPVATGVIAGQITAVGGTFVWTGTSNSIKSQKSFVIDLGGNLPSGTYKFVIDAFSLRGNDYGSNMVVNGLDASNNKLFTGYSGLPTSTFSFVATSAFNRISFGGVGGLWVGQTSTAPKVTISSGNPTVNTTTAGPTWTVEKSSINASAVNTAFGSGGPQWNGYGYGRVYNTGTTWTIFANCSNTSTIGKFVDANGTLTGVQFNITGTSGAGVGWTSAMDTANGNWYYGGGTNDQSGTRNTLTNWQYVNYAANVNTQTARTAIPDNYTYGSGAVFGNGKIYLIGGARYVSGTITTESAARLRIYDIAGNSWTTGASAPAGYALGSASGNVNNYQAGYYDSTNNRIWYAFENNLVAYYSIASDTWTATGNSLTTYPWGYGSLGKNTNSDTNYFYSPAGEGVDSAIRSLKSTFTTQNALPSEGIFSFTQAADNSGILSTYMNQSAVCVGATSDGTTIQVLGVGSHNSTTSYLRVSLPISSLVAVPAYAQ